MVDAIEPTIPHLDGGVIDDDNGSDGQGTMEGFSDVDGIRDVDFYSAVITETGAIAPGKKSFVDIRDKGGRLIRVANLHDFWRLRVWFNSHDSHPAGWRFRRSWEIPSEHAFEFAPARPSSRRRSTVGRAISMGETRGPTRDNSSQRYFSLRRYSR